MWNAKRTSVTGQQTARKSTKTSRYVDVAKRPIDFFGALFLLVLTAPIQLLVAIGVRLSMGSPVIFRQKRITMGGRSFEMYKFRSMREAPNMAPELASAFHASPADPRHTRFGLLIRRLSLDELPQLFNVLKGEMSLIGPRPELVEVAEAFDLIEHPRHAVRPGITGPWQVSPNRHTNVHLHVNLDEAYVEDLTWQNDLRIALRTIPVVIAGKRPHRKNARGKPAVAQRERPLRVLHVAEPSIAGVPAYVDHLGKELAELGVEQTVLVNADCEWPFEEWSKDVHRIEWNRSNPLDTFRAASVIHQLVAHNEIDMIHAHATFAGVAARVRSSPAFVVYQPHGWGYLTTQQPLTRFLARFAEGLMGYRTDLLLTLSEHEAADSPTLSHERVPPLCNLEAFEPPTVEAREQLRAQYGWSSDEVVHLCVGEFSKRKNQQELVERWTDSVGATHRLVLVGAGTTPTNLPVDGPAPIEILGWRNDVAFLMQAADSLVVASKGEGFSLAILEALASGLPVFTTDVGGAEAVGLVDEASPDGRVCRSVHQVVLSAVGSATSLGSTQERRDRAARHRVATTGDAQSISKLYSALVAESYKPQTR